MLIHAVMDAILGALCEGDIGQHFPDTDPMYKGISGMKLLSIVDKIMINKGFRVNNLDTIIIAQEPKLSSYYQKMKKNLVSALSVESNAVNIKATTTEGLGFTGRKEGIMAKAIVMLHKQ